MKFASNFVRRGPDVLALELVTILSTQGESEFKPLFEIVAANFRARKMAGGGAEMLRLRAYDKLRSLVDAGIIDKVGKVYRGVAPAMAAYLEQAAAHPPAPPKDA
jgi:hypothetical protein